MKRKRIISIILPLALFLILLYLVIMVYKDSDEDSYSRNHIFEEWNADPESVLSYEKEYLMPI